MPIKYVFKNNQNLSKPVPLKQLSLFGSFSSNNSLPKNLLLYTRKRVPLTHIPSAHQLTFKELKAALSIDDHKKLDRALPLLKEIFGKEYNGKHHPFDDLARRHKNCILDELNRGGSIPDEVLKDYPGIAPKKIGAKVRFFNAIGTVVDSQFWEDTNFILCLDTDGNGYVSECNVISEAGPKTEIFADFKEAEKAYLKRLKEKGLAGRYR